MTNNNNNNNNNKDDLLKHLADSGFDEKIVNAFAEVDRSRFVPPEYKHRSYEDRALPIGFDQTISQPSTIAFMLSHLKPRDGKIMEVGSGSGYVLALLRKYDPNSMIYGVEIIDELLKKSKEKLRGEPNVKLFKAKNDLGLPNESPFDRIIVSASAPELPYKLVDQLKEGGRMVCPVGYSVLVIDKHDDDISTMVFPGFAFVKLKSL